MNKKVLQPPANASNIQRIVQGIFKEDREVEKVSPFTPERDQKIFLCEFRSGEKVVLKYARIDEWENQSLASSLEIKTPVVVGSFFEIERIKKEEGGEEVIKGWYGQKYIEYGDGKGEKTLKALIEEETPVTKDVFSSAIDLLVQIHNSLDNFQKKKSFSISVLSREHMEEQLYERINGRLLPLFERFDKQGQYQELVEKWQQTVETFDRESTISLLSEEDNPTVLVRWDYKPDNLLVKKQNDKISLFTIDWGVVYIGSPWHDLAFLLGNLEKKERDRYLKEYLELQRRMASGWEKMRFAEVKKRMKLAFPFIQLIHASSNAKFILDGNATDYTFKRLTYHLDTLEEEIRQ